MPRRLLIAAVTLAAFLSVAPTARADWVWPVAGEVITPYRNGDDPYAAGQHRGIDIAAPVGTPVVAATGGEVRFAGTAGSSGLTVSIRTADGAFDTSYLHLSTTTVRKGAEVSAGDRVGAVGTTGKRSAPAPHLHFGVRDAGADHGYHDPLSLLPPAPLPGERSRPEPEPGPLPVPEPARPEPARPEPARPAPAPRALPRPDARHSPRSTREPRPRPIAEPWPRLSSGTTAPDSGTAPERRASLPAVGPAPVPLWSRAAQQRPAHPGPVRPGPRHRPSAAEGALAPEPGLAAPARRDTPGPDLGYALACAGLLLAAALLGLSEDGRHATRRSRARIAGLLRPLVGRS